jgi:predicted nuclease of predicted toxin-antitoxin system
VKLLIDNQLPSALARFLKSNGVSADHVRDHGMQAAKDREIWEFARTHGYVLVSKDEDFPQLANRYGSPPQVIWVRLGNCRKAALLDVFRRTLPRLRGLLDAGERVIELR